MVKVVPSMVWKMTFFVPYNGSARPSATIAPGRLFYQRQHGNFWIFITRAGVYESSRIDEQQPWNLQLTDAVLDAADRVVVQHLVEDRCHRHSAGRRSMSPSSALVA
eukprot:2242312-Heterocapsa_arctica.AAC.1